MRSDARRNRDRLLDAAVEAALAAGGEPSREAVAERAGVGIGTLYRHFPDREALLVGLVAHALDRCVAALDEAVEEERDGVAALRRYLHAAVDGGLGAVNLVVPLLERPAFPEHRARAAVRLDALVARAREGGGVAAELTAVDVVYATVRFSRPLGLGLPPAEDRAIAHRQVDAYVDGLRRGSRGGDDDAAGLPATGEDRCRGS